MTEPGKFEMSSDEMLVAFLDDQLAPEQREALSARLAQDDALAGRLAGLQANHAPLRAAFNMLLAEAPVERMAERFRRASAYHGRTSQSYSRRQIIAASIASLAVGSLAGAYVAYQQKRGDEEWRDAVANYMSLYSGNTLANIPLNTNTLELEVSSVNQSLGMSFKVTDIALPGLELRRAQTLQYKGKPLAQLAYLDSEHKPFAFCMIVGSLGQASEAFEQRYGMNIVYWSGATCSYLIIGHLPPPVMKALVEPICNTFTA